MVMATEDNLAACRVHQDAKVGQQVRGAVHQALIEAAQGTCAKSFQSQAQDAIVRHGPEGLIVQVRGCQHSKVRACLRSARGHTQADVVSYQHTLRSATPKVSLREFNSYHCAVHMAACKPHPRLNCSSIWVDIHGSTRLPRGVTPVFQTGWALTAPVGEQYMSRSCVKQHLQPLWRMAYGDVAHVKAVPCVAMAASQSPSFHSLQPHHQWTRRWHTC
mmetsp:Transcript_132652/g.322304  ORF Transcript_132652/g.322304 Transcript_132652/m.322304 type:complete len:218 (-) Transcript_132652:208-861(-)